MNACAVVGSGSGNMDRVMSSQVRCDLGFSPVAVQCRIGEYLNQFMCDLAIWKSPFDSKTRVFLPMMKGAF